MFSSRNILINLHIADFSSPPKASYAIRLCWVISDNLGQVTIWNIISLKLLLSTNGRVQIVLYATLKDDEQCISMRNSLVLLLFVMGYESFLS